jgi:hypothetical protein
VAGWRHGNVHSDSFGAKSLNDDDDILPPDPPRVFGDDHLLRLLARGGTGAVHPSSPCAAHRFPARTAFFSRTVFARPALFSWRARPKATASAGTSSVTTEPAAM